MAKHLYRGSRPSLIIWDTVLSTISELIKNNMDGCLVVWLVCWFQRRSFVCLMVYICAATVETLYFVLNQREMGYGPRLPGKTTSPQCPAFNFAINYNLASFCLAYCSFNQCYEIWWELVHELLHGPVFSSEIPPLQAFPVHRYPLSHLHSYEPWVFMHIASGPHRLLCSAHSLTSVLYQQQPQQKKNKR